MTAKQWLPQDCVLVRFADDPALLHWRCVLACTEGNKVVVVTPDRDMENTELVVGEIYTEIKRMPEGRLPRGTKDRETYLPRHSPEGVIKPAEMRNLILMADRRVEALRGRRVTGKLAADGRVHLNHPAEGDPEKGDRGVAVQEGQEADSECVWLVVFSEDGKGIGDELSPPGDAQRLNVGGKTLVLFSAGGVMRLVRKVPLDDMVRVARGLKSGIPAEDQKEERDVRILPVLYDTGDERYRTVNEAVVEIEEIDFDDFPLQGPRTVAHDVRQLRRLGLDFNQHHESWLKKSGVRSSDRSVHEHGTLCRALHYMLCYDQLNIAALASAEAINRRRSLIEFAHSGRPDAPSYEGAEEFLGVRESSDGTIVDPALQSHVAKKQAVKAEISKNSRLAAEERRLAGKKGDDKGKGDKGGGKGSGAAAPSQP